MVMLTSAPYTAPGEVITVDVNPAHTFSHG
jgi:hypothetical protein